MIHRNLMTTLIALLPAVVGSTARADDTQKPEKPLRAGIIGLDTSHVIAFTEILNDPKATGELAGVKVVAGYPGGTDIPASKNRVEGFTQRLRDKGVEIVDSIAALLEKVDVVLLESVDGRPHLEQVLPVLKAGKPLFVDKPIAGSLKDAVAIYEAAKLYDVPIFSSSSMRFQEGPQGIRAGKIGNVLGCDAYGPGSLQEHHPDLFWYGIHTVEGLFTCMGTGCETVTRVATPSFDMVVGTWKGGRIGSYRGIRRGKVESGGTAFGSKAVMQYGRGGGGYRPLVTHIARFFRTGKPPVSPEETLEIYAFMEAADESKRQGGIPISIESVLAKARVASAWKGEWDGGGEHRGQLKCLARHVSEEDWEATFTGYCNRKFAYEVLMKGRRIGDKIVFSGEADLGDKDGGLYRWTGEILGETFVGRYSSKKGKKGMFKMQRAKTATRDNQEISE